MADKLRLGNEVKELKIGQSFTNPKSTAFHSIRYDFKPASVDINKIATVDVESDNKVTVTVPHSDGAGVLQTVFQGNQRPYTKECVLILDRVTGEITLEKLSSNIHVKNTRSEFARAPGEPRSQAGERPPTASLAARSKTPPVVGQRTSNKTKVTSGSRRPDRSIGTHLVPKHSPLHASPSYPSPGHNHRSPRREAHMHAFGNDSGAHSASNALASLPMLGADDYADAPRSGREKSPSLADERRIGEITDSSSSSSDSDSDSDAQTTVVHKRANGHASNGMAAVGSSPKLANAHILSEDLCLSESGSDSD